MGNWRKKNLFERHLIPSAYKPGQMSFVEETWTSKSSLSPGIQRLCRRWWIENMIWKFSRKKKALNKWVFVVVVAKWNYSWWSRVKFSFTLRGFAPTHLSSCRSKQRLCVIVSVSPGSVCQPGSFWPAAPTGTMTSRLRGISLRPSVGQYVRTYMHPSVHPLDLGGL